MRIAVTTPTGNIGSKLADLLLLSGADITVLARRPEKVAGLAARGARVVQGDQLDPAAVNQLLEGADGLFWLAPAEYTVRNLREHYNRFGDAGAKAVRSRPDLRVVNLSSVGAQLSEGTGPIKGLHDVEQKLNAVASNVTHLRANYFMENVLVVLPVIAAQNAMFSTIPAEKALPQVATRDIAECAADYLLRPRSGRHVVDVFGPEPISFAQMTATLSQVLEKAVAYVQITRQQLRTGIMQAGMSGEAADQLLEMYEAIASGRLDALDGDAQWQGHTTFEQFAREVVLSAYRRLTTVAKAG